MQYRKKQAENINAFQFPGDDNFELPHFENWSEANGFTDFEWKDENTLSMQIGPIDIDVPKGNYIVKDTLAEGHETFYTLGPNLFEKIYEPVTN